MSKDDIVSITLSNVHQCGLNYRHFGRIVRFVEQLSNGDKETLGREKVDDLIRTLIIEGVARSLKNLVRIISNSHEGTPAHIVLQMWETLRKAKVSTMHSPITKLHRAAFTFLKDFFQGFLSFLF